MKIKIEKNINSYRSTDKRDDCPEEEMGQSIQEWTKKKLWKTAFKKFERICSA